MIVARMREGGAEVKLNRTDPHVRSMRIREKTRQGVCGMDVSANWKRDKNSKESTCCQGRGKYVMDMDAVTVDIVSSSDCVGRKDTRSEQEPHRVRHSG